MTTTTTVHEELTPRQHRLKRIAEVLQWGAAANGLFALLMVVLGIIGGVGGGGLFPTLADVLIGGYGGAADTALLVVVLLALANLSALLVLMVGVLAQELWAPVGLLALIGGNIALLLIFGFLPALISISFAGYALYLSTRDIRAYRTNPLMLKELRERMRGARAFVVMSVYLALMSGFAVLLYLVGSQAGGTSVTGGIGRDLFRGVVGMQLLLIVFIAPAFTAGAVSNERERKTYDLLQITLLPYQSFIIGKLESALGYILLLLLAAIPLQSIAFLFGGVSQTELIIAFVVLTVTAVMLGTVGLFFSTLVDRTLTASIRAYILMFGLTVGLPGVLATIVGVLTTIFSPAYNSSHALQAGATYIYALAESLNPVTAMLKTQSLLSSNLGLGFYTETLFDGITATTIPLASPWLSLTIIYAMIAAVMIVLSVRGLRASDE